MMLRFFLSLFPFQTHAYTRSLSSAIMNVRTEVEFQIEAGSSIGPLEVSSCTGGLLEEWGYTFSGNSTDLKFVVDSETGLDAQPVKSILVECQLEQNVASKEVCVNNIVRIHYIYM